MSRLLAELGVGTRDHIAILHGQPARVLRGRLGRAAARGLLDAGQLAPDCGRGRLHRRGLRRPCWFASAGDGRGGRAAGGADARTQRLRGRRWPEDEAARPALPSLERRGRRAVRRNRSGTRLRVTRSSTRPARPAGRRVSGRISRSRRSVPGSGSSQDAGGFGFERGHRLPVPGAAIPRGADRLVDGHHPARRHGRADGAVRPGRVPAARSSGTASRLASSCRPTSSGCSSCRRRNGRRFDVSTLQTVVHAAAPCPVEVKRQMIDWLGPVLVRVLRRQRGKRDRRWSAAGEWLTHPGSVGRALVGAVHILADDGAELPAGAGRDDLLRGPMLSSTTTTRSRPAARATTRAGPPSATSATWTTRASCTCPTGAPT